VSATKRALKRQDQRWCFPPYCELSNSLLLIEKHDKVWMLARSGYDSLSEKLREPGSAIFEPTNRGTFQCHI
jgi:hypothetical protein